MKFLHSINVVLSLVFVFDHSTSEALKILGIFPHFGRSHSIPNSVLMKGLANRQHQVDVISGYPLERPIPNYTDISLAGMSPSSTNNLTYQEALIFNQFSKEGFVHYTGTMTCDLLSTHLFQKLLKTPKKTYDVIIVELFTAHCFLAFGKHLDAPVVGTIMSKIQDWDYEHFGVPLNPAYTASLFSSSSQSMTFLERLKNIFLVNTVATQMNHYIDRQREHVDRHFGRKLSSMNELYDDVSLVLVNSHYSLNGIQPMPPGVIEVGGLHLHGNEQVLSPDIKKWLDDSENGCIYFSFGSMVRIETFPSKALSAFYEMFENIAPVRVLLKIVNTTELPPNLPANVKISLWFSQIAILKHPNIKAFVTHGGQMGLQEAIFYSVPIVGLPIFSDQFTNMRTCTEKKIAITLNHQDVTGQSLTDAVKTVLTDPTYRNNMKTLSKLFNDRPMNVLDTAIYWVEFAARHGNVLKSPATRLTWWQYRLFDVYGVILICVSSALYILIFMLKSSLRFICSRKSEQPTENIAKWKKIE